MAAAPSLLRLRMRQQLILVGLMLACLCVSTAALQRVPSTSASLQPRLVKPVIEDGADASSSCSCACDEKDEEACASAPKCDCDSTTSSSTVLVAPSSASAGDTDTISGTTDAAATKESEKILEEVAPPAEPFVPEPVPAPAVSSNATDGDVVKVVEETEAEREAKLDNYVQNYTSASVEKMTDLIDRAFAEGAAERHADHVERAERGLQEEKLKDEVLRAEKMARLEADEATKKQQIKFRHDMDKFGADEAAKIEREENHKQNLKAMRQDRKQEESQKMDRILEIRSKQYESEKARRKAWSIAEHDAQMKKEQMDKDEKDLKELIARQRKKLDEVKGELGNINKKRDDRVRTMAEQKSEWEQEESVKTNEIEMREEAHKVTLKQSEQSNKDLLLNIKDDQGDIQKAQEEQMKAKTNEAMEKSKVHEQQIKAFREKTASKQADFEIANEQVQKSTEARKKELTYEKFDAFKKEE